MTSESNFFNSVGPKRSFVFGIVSTLAIVFFIGFFVMLGIFLKSDDNDKKVAGNVVSGKAQPTQPAPPTQGGGDIRLAAITNEDHILGSIDAPIKIVEFSDTECPFCKRFHPTIQQVIKDYDGKVAWVYRHFPLDSLHPKARKEAEATECAAELGGNDSFWKYLDRIFEITPSNNGLNSDELPNIAEFIGLDRNKFTECLDSGKYASHISDNLADAQAAGGRGTPYSVIIAGDQKIPASGALPVSQIKAMIDSLLQ